MINHTCVKKSSFNRAIETPMYGTALKNDIQTGSTIISRGNLWEQCRFAGIPGFFAPYWANSNYSNSQSISNGGNGVFDGITTIYSGSNQGPPVYSNFDGLAAMWNLYRQMDVSYTWNGFLGDTGSVGHIPPYTGTPLLNHPSSIGSQSYAYSFYYVNNVPTMSGFNPSIPNTSTPTVSCSNYAGFMSKGGYYGTFRGNTAVSDSHWQVIPNMSTVAIPYTCWYEHSDVYLSNPVDTSSLYERYMNDFVYTWPQETASWTSANQGGFRAHYRMDQHGSGTDLSTLWPTGSDGPTIFGDSGNPLTASYNIFTAPLSGIHAFAGWNLYTPGEELSDGSIGGTLTLERRQAKLLNMLPANATIVSGSTIYFIGRYRTTNQRQKYQLMGNAYISGSMTSSMMELVDGGIIQQGQVIGCTGSMVSTQSTMSLNSKVDIALPFPNPPFPLINLSGSLCNMDIYFAVIGQSSMDWSNQYGYKWWNTESTL